MHSFTSFSASAVAPDELNRITADYLALERIRVFRRLLVKRFGILTVIVAAVSLAWLSRFALWFSVGLCLTPPVWAWTIELRRERRLAARLNDVPGQRTASAAGPNRIRLNGTQESRKKFISTEARGLRSPFPTHN
jgi:hypothetical protein